MVARRIEFFSSVMCSLLGGARRAGTTVRRDHPRSGFGDWLRDVPEANQLPAVVFVPCAEREGQGKANATGVKG